MTTLAFVCPHRCCNHNENNDSPPEIFGVILGWGLEKLMIESPPKKIGHAPSKNKDEIQE